MRAKTRGNPVTGFMLFMTIVLALVMLFPRGQMPSLNSFSNPEPIVESVNYRDIPLSGHAKNDHSNEHWRSETIRQYFIDGKCTPKVDICREDDFEVHWCRLNDKMSIALVIGHTLRQVITGYIARTSYWAGKCGV